MDLYAELDEFREGIRAHAWRDVEAQAAARCREINAAICPEAEAVDLSGYGEQLDLVARGAADAASEAGAAAVYWEFDPDAGWDSAFFLCAQYTREEVGDDEWASDFDEEKVVPGPSQPDLAELFAPSWDGTDADAARNLLLVVRTVVAFGRAVADAWPGTIPLCAGFHDQDLLFRIVEPPPG